MHIPVQIPLFPALHENNDIKSYNWYHKDGRVEKLTPEQLITRPDGWMLRKPRD